MYTILPDGTVASIGAEEGETKHLTLVEIAARLREAYAEAKN